MRFRSTVATRVEGAIYPYNFPVYPKPADPIDEQNYPSVPGIYVVLKQERKGGYELVYVGSTDRTIRKRFPEHWDEGGEGPCFDNEKIGGWTHWGFLEIKDGRTPEEAENDILMAQRTRCNRKYPKGGPTNL